MLPHCPGLVYLQLYKQVVAPDNFTVSQRIQKHSIFHHLRDDINRKVRPKKISVVPVTCHEKNRVGRSEKNFFQ